MSFVFKIKLRGVSKPPVWRRVAVPESFTFADFHLVIQAAFGWTNSHLYEFADSLYNPDFLYNDPSSGFDIFESGGDDARYSTLSEYFRSPGDKMIYTYDFGDSWEHDIVLEEINADNDSTPHCHAGKGACPPEDCGGIYGYKILKDEGEVDPKEFDLEDADDAVVHWRLLKDILQPSDEDEDFVWNQEIAEEEAECDDDFYGVTPVSDEQIKKAVSDAVMLLASGQQCYVDYVTSTCSRTKPGHASKFCVKLKPPTEKQKVAFARDFIKTLPKKDATIRSSLALSLNAANPVEAFTNVIAQSPYADNWVEAMHDFYAQIVASKAAELYSNLMDELTSFNND